MRDVAADRPSVLMKAGLHPSLRAAMAAKQEGNPAATGRMTENRSILTRRACLDVRPPDSRLIRAGLSCSSRIGLIITGFNAESRTVNILGADIYNSVQTCGSCNHGRIRSGITKAGNKLRL